MEKIQKTDRRTRYTCQTIKDILLEELKTKPYNKITVTEICKKAEIESYRITPEQKVYLKTLKI